MCVNYLLGFIIINILFHSKVTEEQLPMLSIANRIKNITDISMLLHAPCHEMVIIHQTLFREHF